MSYSTLVFTYEWPTADTPSPAAAANTEQQQGGVPSSSLRERLAELAQLHSEGLISTEEHGAARKAALGIY